MHRRVATLAVLLIVGLVAVTPAQAQQDQQYVVSANPVDWTPHVLDGTVYAFAIVGRTAIVGGMFTKIRDVRGSTYDRSNLFAFDLDTGRVSPSFAPSVDGAVRALASSPNRTVTAGGEFTEVNGEERPGLVQLSMNGEIRQTFTTTLNDKGLVRSLARRGNKLYVGGQFTALGGVTRPALARLDASTGRVDPSFDMRLEIDSTNRLWVQSLALSQDGTMLAFDGTFTRVAGEARYQLAIVDTSGGVAELAPWWTNVYKARCDDRYETYLRGLDFSADGSYLVVVTTGHSASPDLPCDAAARFETSEAGEQRPTWINHTGGNTLLSVAVTGSAVYVGGHQQWLDNPYGKKSRGPGAVSRPGIGAIDPETGKALSWNPTKSRGVGTEALLAYPGGLLVGSDTDQLGGEYHARVGIFPIDD